MKMPWAATALLLLAGPLHAQGQDALYARSLAATCASCHSTDGRAVGNGGIWTDSLG
ncbi:MAG: hypothetical protein JWQ13_773 [Ramlibacter sp.]|nr:hypothetical protein [Ramlibacter sp.]